MSEFKTKYGPWAIVTGANAGIGRSIDCRQQAAKLSSIRPVMTRGVPLSRLTSTLRLQRLYYTGMSILQ